MGAGKSLVALALVCDPPTAVSKMEVVASGGARTIRVTTMDPIQEYAATPVRVTRLPGVEESTSDASDESGDEETERSNCSTFIIARSLKPRHNSVFYSKISQELFWSDKNNCFIDHCYFSEYNHEFGIRGANKYYFYDFVAPTKKKIIEFNGD